MKPLKLVLQAFGPFAKTECIDFTALGHNPLFLINGPTGAGKSSLLDAICFALFGETTGAEREAAQMRCDHAEDSLITEVILDFSLGAKKYRIRRIPAQTRPRLRGDGVTVQNPEAQLWVLDGSAEGELLVAKKVSDANAHIIARLGLTVEQFRQVIVLPQGKFRDLLMANSAERESIFSQLFQTHIYKRIEDQLKSKAATIRQAVTAHHQQINGILQSAAVNSEAEIDDELVQLAVQLVNAASDKDNAQQLQVQATLAKQHAHALKQRFDTLHNKEVELKNKDTEAPYFHAQQKILDNASVAEKIQPLYIKYQDKSNALSVLTQHISNGIRAIETSRSEKTEAEKRLNSAKQALVKVDDLKIQQHRLTQFKVQVTQLESARVNWRSKEKISQESQAKLNIQLNIQAKLRNELSELDRLNASYSLELLTLAPKQIELSAQGITLSKRTKLEELLNKKQVLEHNEAQFLTFFSHKQRQFESSQLHVRQTELAWHSGQAALLAAELKVGIPCSVCGSKEHPLPARVDDSASLITKQQLDEARTLEDTARAVMQKAEHELGNTRTELTTIQCQINELELILNDSTQQTVEYVTLAFKAIEVEVTRLLQLQNTQSITLSRMAEIKQQLPEIENTLAILQTQAIADQTALIQAAAEVTQLESTLPEAYRDTGQLTQELSLIEDTIIQLTEALTFAQDQFTEKQSQLITLTVRQEELEIQAKTMQWEQTQAELSWSQALAQSVFTDTQGFQEALLSEATQQTIKTAIETFKNALTGLHSVVEQLKAELQTQCLPDLLQLEQDLSDKSHQFNVADAAWRKCEERNNLLIHIKTQLNQARHKSADLEAQYQVYGTLSDVANGTSGQRISLQRFVLSVLLDDVLIQASQRLNTMSKGRYLLLRKKERTSGNSASGLDLEVEDGYTGKTRAVATLSGGESFMAALSLALGLSDVVQSYAGGIKLDTLFIDEGFGSLDPESLDLAIRTLIDLQSSGRMIGIISHVTELKEQMALRIDVKSSRDGSSISMVSNKCN